MSVALFDKLLTWFLSLTGPDLWFALAAVIVIVFLVSWVIGRALPYIAIAAFALLTLWLLPWA